MARRDDPKPEFRHFRKDGVTQFTEIPIEDPEVFEVMSNFFAELKKVVEKDRKLKQMKKAAESKEAVSCENKD